jgi:putative zinc finger/helix-turn-helix YgiT family protein
MKGNNVKLYCPKCDQISEVEIKNLNEAFNVRGEQIDIESQVTFCKNCGEKVFNQELDDKNLDLAYSVYRERHNLLPPLAIAETRKKYGLSQRALSQLLEWGEITIHRYESGAVQDPAHNEVLILIDDPRNMKEIFDKNKRYLSDNINKKLEDKINELIREEVSFKNRVELLENYFLFDTKKVDEFTGFSSFNLEKMINLIVYIAEKTNGVFTTKLNKLLWYMDFLYFKGYTISITGSDYVHLPLGPVPNEYKWIIAAALDGDFIGEEEISYSSGYTGLQYKAVMNINNEYFSQNERKILDFIIDYFKEYNCEDIKEMSHKEKAYRETQMNQRISYKYANDLSISLPK